ncbi:MAG TPA: hypothetical protein VL361_21300 [Candidatus Limnocylindrales bacterium]|jgi:hypothetical protein|nr:hypothetical protein [Candidatus Limnocylindrales bacterium]
MTFCPKMVAFSFGPSPSTGATYNGYAFRGADGIGKVYYPVNGITDVTVTWAAYGQFYLYGWMCRIASTLGFIEIQIPWSNTELAERKVTSIYLGCGGRGGGSPGGDSAASTKMVPTNTIGAAPSIGTVSPRFECSGGGGSVGSGSTIVTVTSCDYMAYFDSDGTYLYTVLLGCRQVLYYAT